MTTTTYAVVFTGELKEGFELNQVKQNFAKVFKTDPARVEAFFSGKPVVIKKGLDKNGALKYTQVLQKAGAQIKVLAQKPAAENSASAPAAQGEPSVLPAGSELLRPEERKQVQAVDVDISHLEIKRNVAKFGALDDEEDTVEAAEPTAAAATISSDFDLAPVGADIGDATEAVELPELDLSELSVAEVGADVLAEKPPAPQAPAVDISALSVAPQDGELYPERPQETVPEAPDTSHLKLAD